MIRIARLIPMALAGLLTAALPTPGQAQAQPRHYDCSKAGNANKAVCKGQSAPTAAPAPAPSPASKAPVARHYDCSKAGNANKSVCKGVATAPAPMPMAPAPTASSHPTVARPTVATAPATVPGNGNPTAKCRDGSVSYSAHRSGTCSHHGGVASWM